jgi:hypothetical protein
MNEKINGNVYPYVKDGVTWGFGPDEHWPPGYAAKVVEAQYDLRRHLVTTGQERTYLDAGDVARVVSDEGDHLFISFVKPGTLEVEVTPISKAHVIPVPNYLDEGPAEIEERLEDSQRLVSDLVDDGYQLDRALTEEDEVIWSAFFGQNIQRPFGLWFRVESDGREVENAFFLTSAWPTAVSVATEL